MGLNESYVIVRGSMLMMNPLPTMPQVYRLFAQEERQGRLMPIYILVMIILFFWHLVTKVKWNFRKYKMIRNEKTIFRMWTIIIDLSVFHLNFTLEKELIIER